MKYNDALNLAKKILELRPNYVIAGSVALILQGVIAERDIHDLDFACTRDSFTYKAELNWGGRYDLESDYNTVRNDENTCFKVRQDNGFYYDVFVFDEADKLEYTELNGIKVQSINQVLKYKRQFAREKDILDLEHIDGIPF